MEQEIYKVEKELSEVESLLLETEFSKVPKRVKNSLISILEEERDLLKIELNELQQELNYMRGI